MVDESKCQYQSTNCENARARRENGELHRLCALHRDKANETQRRWHNRHKANSRSLPTSKQSSPSARRNFARLSEDLHRHSPRRVTSISRRQPRLQQPTETVMKTATIGAESCINLTDAAISLTHEPTSYDPVFLLSDDDIESLTTLVMEFNAR